MVETCLKSYTFDVSEKGNNLNEKPPTRLHKFSFSKKKNRSPQKLIKI